MGSCQFDASQYRYNLGDDFVDDPTVFMMIDTLTVNTYTIAIDSLYSSRPNRFMVGNAEDMLGIKTTCEAYFRFDPPVLPDFNNDATFDSICIIFHPDSYYYGDSSKVDYISLYSLIEDITVNSETGYIYNNKQFACETTPLVTFGVDMTNKHNDSITVRLPDEYGKAIFDLAINGDAVFDDNDNFHEAYKGFALKPATSDLSCIVGFNAYPDSASSLRIRIFYHDFTPDDNLFFEYSLEPYEIYTSNSTSSTLSYVNYYGTNYIHNDYSNSDFKDIKTDEAKLSSTLTGNVSLLQAGVNLRTKVEIPYIDNLNEMGIGSVVKATLYVEPADGSYKYKSDLPSTLELYLVDTKNRNYGQVKDLSSGNAILGILTYNEEFKNQTYYTFDITRFLRDEYISREDPEYSLLLALPQSEISDNVDQLILGNQKNGTDKLRMKLYLTNY